MPRAPSAPVIGAALVAAWASVCHARERSAAASREAWNAMLVRDDEARALKRRVEPDQPGP